MEKKKKEGKSLRRQNHQTNLDENEGRMITLTVQKEMIDNEVEEEQRRGKNYGEEGSGFFFFGYKNLSILRSVIAAVLTGLVSLKKILVLLFISLV